MQLLTAREITNDPKYRLIILQKIQEHNFKFFNFEKKKHSRFRIAQSHQC